MKPAVPWVLSLALALVSLALYLRLQDQKSPTVVMVLHTNDSRPEIPPALQRQSHTATGASAEEPANLRRDHADLLRLRNEVHQLREQNKELTTIRRRLSEHLDNVEQLLLASATNNMNLQNALDEATGPTQAEREAISRKPGLLGVVLGIVNKSIIISAVSDNSPASRAELEPGSVVVAVDGTALAGKTLGEAMLAIRGEVGTQVTLDLLEGKPPEKRTVTLTREKAPFVVVSDPP